MEKTTTKKVAVKKVAKATSKKEAGVLEATLYNQTAKSIGTVALPPAVFGLALNTDLVHQVATAIQANARPNVAHTKDRSEIRGGGKKPWKQKGTGRSRHGSTRSPIWRHGGVTFGPRSEKDYSQKINKKMRTKALFSVLSAKNRDGEMIFIDEIKFKEMKTANAQIVIDAFASMKEFEKLGHKRANRGLILIDGRNEVLEKSFANIPQVDCEQLKDLNVLDVLTHKFVIVIAPETAFAFLGSKTA
ncbi:MAG: 50S ribosomal protein L4 [bacterium]